MGVNFNRGEVPQALAWFFGIKGPYTATVGQDIQPSVNVADITDSPYLSYGIPVALGGGVAAAGAGRFGHIILQPGPSVALQIKKLMIANTSASAWPLSVRILTATQIATLANLSTPIKAKDLANQTATTLRSSQHRTGDLNSTPGNFLFSLTVPANTDRDVDLPDPVVLYGNDPGGVPGLIVVNGTANLEVTAYALGKEWPLPG